jgi:hypothetical protein
MSVEDKGYSHDTPARTCKCKLSCVADRRSVGKKSTRGTGMLAAAVAPQVTIQYALVFNHSSNKDLRGCTLHEL